MLPDARPRRGAGRRHRRRRRARPRGGGGGGALGHAGRARPHAGGDHRAARDPRVDVCVGVRRAVRGRRRGSHRRPAAVPRRRPGCRHLRVRAVALRRRRFQRGRIALERLFGTPTPAPAPARATSGPRSRSSCASSRGSPRSTGHHRARPAPGCTRPPVPGVPVAAQPRGRRPARDTSSSTPTPSSAARPDREQVALDLADLLVTQLASSTTLVAAGSGSLTPAELTELVLDVVRNAANKIAVALGGDAPVVSKGIETTTSTRPATSSPTSTVRSSGPPPPDRATPDQARRCRGRRRADP